LSEELNPVISTEETPVDVAQVPAPVEEAVVDAAPAPKAEATTETSEAVNNDRPQTGDRPAYGERPQRQQRGPYRRRRRPCQFCVDKTQHIDYKETAKLSKFLNERNKIVARRTTGTCAKHQRQLTEAIKRSRQVALLPYVVE